MPTDQVGDDRDELDGDNRQQEADGGLRGQRGADEPGSVVSLSAVEKTPESAMTAAPHTNKKTTRTTVGAAKKSGEATQQVPLITQRRHRRRRAAETV